MSCCGQDDCAQDDCKTCGKGSLREGLEGVLLDALNDRPPASDEECDSKCDAYLERALRLVKAAAESGSINDYCIPGVQVNEELVRQLGFADQEIRDLKTHRQTLRMALCTALPYVMPGQPPGCRPVMSQADVDYLRRLADPPGD